MDAAPTVPEPSFRVVRLREGYDVEEVDEFVDRCTTALTRGGPGDLTAATVREVRFSARRFRPAYDVEDVDRYLDQVADELERRRPPQTS